MPAAIEYVPRTARTPEAQQIEDAFRSELAERHKDYAKRWNYYYGKHHKHLKKDQSGTDDNIIINVCGLAIDKGVSALVGSNDAGIFHGVSFEVVDEPGEAGFEQGQGIPANAEQAQQVVDAVWQANNQHIFLHNVALNAAVTGHAFVKIVPGGAMSDSGDSLPRLINLNPAIVSVFWDEADIERVLWYRIQYGPESRQVCEDYVREMDEARQDTGRWLVYVYRRTAQQAQWQMVGESVWEYQWPPIVDWQNLPVPNQYYGRDDLGNNAALNDGINFVMSNMQRIIKHHAHPKTVAIGVSADQIQPTGVNRLWAIPNEKARVEQLEMQSDLSSSLVYAQTLRRAFFDSEREVDPSGVHDRLGQLTNFALRVLYNDTLNKVGTKRLLMSRALVALNQRIMALAGIAPVKLNVNWPDPLPQSEVEQAQALSLDAQHGLSNQTYLERRGYDAEQERQRNMEAGQAENMLLADLFASTARAGGFS